MGYLIPNLVTDRKGPRCFNCNNDSHFIRDGGKENSDKVKQNQHLNYYRTIIIQKQYKILYKQSTEVTKVFNR